MRLITHLRLVLLLSSTILATSPTGPGKYILSRPTTGAPVDLANIDTAFHAVDPLQVNPNGTFSLKKSLAAAGTFGDATHVAQITVDTFGIIHNVTNVTISGGGGGGGGGTVTSVGLTAPSIFTVTGSPVVGMGNLGFSWNGTSTNLVNADGSTTPAANFLTPSTKLTGFASGANSTILATDSMISAFAKAQGQIDALPSRFQPLENQRLSTSYSPTFAGLTLTSASWEQPTARTTSGSAGAGWQIADPSQGWSFQIRQDGLSGSTAHSWSIDDITANVLRVWGNATKTVFKTEVNVDGAISEGGTYLSSKYLGILGNALTASRWNSGITISATQDLSYTTPSITGVSNVSSAATVTGIRGVNVPSPTAGLLRYTGATLVWDNTDYLVSGSAASFSALSVTNLPQNTLPRVVNGVGTLGASAVTDDGTYVTSSRQVSAPSVTAKGIGSATPFAGPYLAMLPTNTASGGGLLQYRGAGIVELWVSGSDPGDDFEKALVVDHTSTLAQGDLDVAGGTTLHSIVQMPTIPNGSVLGITDAYGTVGPFNLAGALSNYLPLAGGTLTGSLYGPYAEMNGVSSKFWNVYPASTPTGDYGDRKWTWDCYGPYNGSSNATTLRLQRSIGGGSISPPDLLVDWTGKFSFGGGAQAVGAGSDSYSPSTQIGVGDVSTAYVGGGLQRSAADNLDVWVGNTSGTGANRVVRFGKDLTTTTYGNLNMAVGATLPSTQVLHLGGTAQVAAYDASGYIGFRGFGLGPWTFSRYNVALISPYTVSATFNEGVDAHSTSYFEDASVSGTAYLNNARTTGIVASSSFDRNTTADASGNVTVSTLFTTISLEANGPYQPARLASVPNGTVNGQQLTLLNNGASGCLVLIGIQSVTMLKGTSRTWTWDAAHSVWL